MGDFLKSAFGYFGNTVSGKPENDFVGQFIEVGNQNLRVKRVIAQGGFAVVFEAQDTATQKEYALKRLIVHDEEASEGVLHEIAILKKLSGHPNIVQFISAASVGKEKSRHIGTEFLIVTELCRGELVDELRAKGRAFPCNTVLMIFYQSCKAVQHMHKQSPPVIHRDLKVENFLLSMKNVIKLCDFGSCTTHGQYPDQTWSALKRGSVTEEMEKNTTPMYRTPEMLDLYQNYPINEAGDIWALGCVLYLLCFNVHPFEDSAKLAILNANYTIPANDQEYRVFHNLIRQMLLIDPRQRPTISDIVSELHEVAASRECKLTGTIPFDVEPRRPPAPVSIAAPAPAAPRGLDTPVSRERTPSPSLQRHVGQQPASPRPPGPHQQRPPVPQQPGPGPAQYQQGQPGQQQQGAGMFGFLKGSAGNLMRNIKDASSKVMETVSATMNKGDMDLNYITSRIIVLSFPVEGGIETIARNHIEDVQSFLDARHSQQYAVYNLASRTTRSDRFQGRLSQRGFDPTTAPALHCLIELCVNMVVWLTEAPGHLCVVYCLDGKAASALLVCALMCFCRLFDHVNPALQLFSSRRCNPNLTASQIRYVHYVCSMVKPEPELPHHKPVMLVNVTLSPVPMFNRMKTGCRPYVEIYQDNKRVYSSLTDYETMRVYSIEDGQIVIPLNGVSATGDVTISLYHTRSSFASKGKISSLKICQIQFYTGYVHQDQNTLHFKREELDHLDTPDKYPDNFKVSIDIVVSPSDKPRAGKHKAPLPWENLSCQGMSKETLFMEMDEMRQIVKDFARFNKSQRPSVAANSDDTTDDDSSPEHTSSSARPEKQPPPKPARPAEQPVAAVPTTTDFFSNLDWAEPTTTTEASDDSSNWGAADADNSLPAASTAAVAVNEDDFADFLAARQTSSTGPPPHQERVADLLGFGGSGSSAEQQQGSLTSKHPSNYDLLSGAGEIAEPVPPAAPSIHVADDLLSFGAGGEGGGNTIFDPFGGEGQTQPAAPHAATTAASSEKNKSFKPSFDPFADLPSGMAGGVTLQATPLSDSRQSSSSSLNTKSSAAPPDPFSDFNNLFGGAKKPDSLNTITRSPHASPQHQRKPPMGSGYQMGGSSIPPQQPPAPTAATTAPPPRSTSPRPSPAATPVGSGGVSWNNVGGGVSGTGTKPRVGEHAFGDLLGDAFGPGGKTNGNAPPRTMKEMRREQLVKETDPEKLKVIEWVEGKERNIRALLCSLPTMLWDGVRWNGVNMAELVSIDHVKKQYKNAVRAIHPDKWMGTEYENISKMIVIELNDAMTEFEREKDAATGRTGLF